MRVPVDPPRLTSAAQHDVVLAVVATPVSGRPPLWMSAAIDGSAGDLTAGIRQPHVMVARPGSVVLAGAWTP